MARLSTVEKYAQPDVVKFWYEFAKQGLQACEEEMLACYAPPPARVLDLGCGGGRAGLALTPHGYEVTGLDLSWQMLAAARELSEGACLLQADLKAIPCANESYDVALILIAALQHIPTRRARQNALAEIARVLKPRGILILALDNLAPALTCYAWWGWKRFTSPLDASSRKLPSSTRVRANASPPPSPIRRGGKGERSADAMLESRRNGASAWAWHARGLARTLRWRTWNGWIDAARMTHVIGGEIGDTEIDQVSLTPTPGRVYYHIYRHDELLADAEAGRLKLLGYHSGRELSEGKTFALRVRQLDKQVLYAFSKSGD